MAKVQSPQASQGEYLSIELHLTTQDIIDRERRLGGGCNTTQTVTAATAEEVRGGARRALIFPTKGLSELQRLSAYGLEGLRSIAEAVAPLVKSGTRLREMLTNRNGHSAVLAELERMLEKAHASALPNAVTGASGELDSFLEANRESNESIEEATEARDRSAEELQRLDDEISGVSAKFFERLRAVRQMDQLAQCTDSTLVRAIDALITAHSTSFGRGNYGDALYYFILVADSTTKMLMELSGIRSSSRSGVREVVMTDLLGREAVHETDSHGDLRDFTLLTPNAAPALAA